MHHVHLDNKEVTYYANQSLGERCFVHLMELHLPKKVREEDLFHGKPANTLNETKT